jgi:hypothetical protein
MFEAELLVSSKMLLLPLAKTIVIVALTLIANKNEATYLDY